MSNTAARTIDPAIGASTWAFGNHKCKPYRGIFTIKAIMHANHRRELLQEFASGLEQCWVIKMFSDPVMFCK